MIRDIFDYIYYRITLFHELLFDLLCITGDYHQGRSEALFSILITCNIMSVIKLFGVLTKIEFLYLFVIILLIILGVLIWYIKGDRRYEALKYKYRNDKWHSLKGYGVLTYVILSIVFFFVAIFSK